MFWVVHATKLTNVGEVLRGSASGDLFNFLWSMRTGAGRLATTAVNSTCLWTRGRTGAESQHDRDPFARRGGSQERMCGCADMGHCCGENPACAVAHDALTSPKSRASLANAPGPPLADCASARRDRCALHRRCVLRLAVKKR